MSSSHNLVVYRLISGLDSENFRFNRLTFYGLFRFGKRRI